MMRRLRAGGFNFNFIGHATRWFLISGIIMVISLGSLVFKGANLGLEFKGGTAFQVVAKKPATVGSMKSALAAVNVHDPVIQQIGKNGFLLQTKHLAPELQQAAAEQIAKAAGVVVKDVNVTDVGPKWGKQITAKMLRALIIFLIIVSIYISIRFEPKMAGTAMVALFHDLLATAGIYSLTGITVTPTTVIAILTILGYSLYDTVIIFDRVKERTSSLSAAGRLTYSDVANQSLNDVLVRSLNTSLMSLIPVGSLLFVGSFLLGAQTLEELALALFIGIAVGTYSSIFIAAPMLALWKERETRWATLRARIQARGAEPAAPRLRTGGATTAVVTAEETDTENGQQERARAAANRGNRPPQRRKKKKRKR